MADFARARPIRVAFLVDRGPDEQRQLDGIFDACHGWWGGRFSLIVPVVAGAISDQYRLWLTRFDPDVIYSFACLTEEMANDLHDTLYPGVLVEHWRQRERPSFAPDVRLDPMTSLSTLPLLTRRTPWDRTDEFRLLDATPGRKPARWLMDTFGFRGMSEKRWPIAPSLRTFALPLFYPTENETENPRTGFSDVDEAVGDQNALLDRLAKGGVVTMSRLSAMQARRLEIHDRDHDAFELFLGETFEERLAFWNRRQCAPAHYDNSVVSLRIGRDELMSGDTVEHVADFIRAMHPAGGSQALVSIVSTSHSGDDLQAVRTALMKTNKWHVHSATHVSDPENLVPSMKALSEARFVEGGYDMRREAKWHEVTRRGDRIHAAEARPSHLEYLRAEHGAASKGIWAIDCDIERTTDTAFSRDEAGRWRLPRRPRLVGAFQIKRSLNAADATLFIMARATAHGYLTIFADRGGSSFQLVEPTDENAFRHGIVQGRAWSLTRWSDGKPRRRDEIAEIVRPSDKGRYLTGVLHLFGGLSATASVLAHPFWAKWLGVLGGAHSVRDEAIKEIAKRLTKKKRQIQGFDLKSDDSIAHLSEIAFKVAAEERDTVRSISYTDLDTDFRALREQFSARHPRQDRDDGFDYDAYEAAYLPRSVQSLCARGILIQGHQWSCSRCEHKNWAAIQSLSPTLSCDICGENASAPVNTPWQFRLNEFIGSALRDHGIGAVVWCLSRLRNESAGESFAFIPPVEIVYERPKKGRALPDTDVDVLAVTGAKTTICEVKSSSRDLDITNLVEVARRFRPDRVVAAIAAPKSSRTAALEGRLAAELKDLGLTTEVWTRRTPDETTPYLPLLDE